MYYLVKLIRHRYPTGRQFCDPHLSVCRSGRTCECGSSPVTGHQCFGIFFSPASVSYVARKFGFTTVLKFDSRLPRYFSRVYILGRTLLSWKYISEADHGINMKCNLNIYFLSSCNTKYNGICVAIDCNSCVSGQARICWGNSQTWTPAWKSQVR